MRDSVILCGPVRRDLLPAKDHRPFILSMWEPGRNVRLLIEDMCRELCADVPPAFRDLIEIATYVHVADSAVSRGSRTDENGGAAWRRRLFFRIAVRRPDLWRSRRVHDELVRTLGFLSEDEYRFEFEHLKEEPRFADYFNFGKHAVRNIEEVVLFSGGLDSAAGAVEEVLVQHREVALVNHRSGSKRIPRHMELLSGLRRRRGDAASPWHIPIRITKDSTLNREFTQRSRSFVYASLGAAVAMMVGRRRVRFYENGVVSINLPLASQVVGARATRTTHPRVLAGFSRLFSALSGEPFEVDNPFRWKTRTDIVKMMADAGHAELIRLTNSCASTWERTRNHPHCGICSQCIDRRFGILAAGLGANDPVEGYEVDLVLGHRPEGHARTMLAVYVESVNQLERMGRATFFSRYGEAMRVLRHTEAETEATALEVFQLYQRHARQVVSVVDRSLGEHAPIFRRRNLPEGSLLQLVQDAGGVPEAVSARAEDPLAENCFRRERKTWRVRFNGGAEFSLLPSRGAAYLHELLSRPGESIPAAQLVFAVTRNPALFALSDAGETLDREALASYRLRLLELDEEAEEARADNAVGDIDRIEEERGMILDQLKKSFGLGNRPRKEADERKSIRIAVRQALKRVIEEIDDDSPALAAHLTPPCLICGCNPRYCPPDGVRWQL